MKPSLYSRYYTESCNEWRDPSPRLSAWTTHLRRNIAARASRSRHYDRFATEALIPLFDVRRLFFEGALPIRDIRQSDYHYKLCWPAIIKAYKICYIVLRRYKLFNDVVTIQRALPHYCRQLYLKHFLIPGDEAIKLYRYNSLISHGFCRVVAISSTSKWNKQKNEVVASSPLTYR